MLAIAAAAIVGCADRATGPRHAEPQRLIAAAPVARFDRAKLDEAVVVYELDLTADSEQRRWQRSDGGAPAAGPGGLTLPDPAEGVGLVRSGSGAGPCAAVALETNPVRRGEIALTLGVGSPTFSAARGVLLAGPARTRFLFELGEEVAGAPALRLVRGGAVTASLLTCLSRRDDPEALVRVAAAPWKVVLDDEIRFAVPALPGAPVAFAVTVPRGGVLRFGYGVEEDQPVAIAFDVAVRAEGAEPVVLFRREAIAPGRWHDAEVDLGGFAGRRVTLELSTRAARRADPRRGLAFFAHPVVAARATATRRAPPSVVLISIDTLRADRLELYGYARRTMPHLTAWARREGIVFERAVAQAPWTLPSHASMLTGIDPLVHGVNLYEPAPEALLLLSEILYARGYETLAVTGGAYLDPDFGLDQGFERYRSFRGNDHEHELERSLAAATAWLRASAGRDAPFFLFFHTYDVHEPYLARAPFFAEFSGGRRDYPPVGTRGVQHGRDRAFQGVRELAFSGDGGEGAPDPQLAWAAYDSDIAHTDEGIHRLLGLLAELGIAEDTIVVFTSDHGEALGEHGLAGHGYLYDHNLLVPLILRLPRRQAAGTRVARQVRSIDIVPTVLELLDLSPPEPISGRSLLPLIRGDGPPPPAEAWSYNAIANQGLAVRHADGYKYVLVDPAWKPTEMPAEALFDLVADPGEHRPAAVPTARLVELRRAAQRRLRDEATGIHFQVDNPSRRTLCAYLHSSLVRPNTVKVPGPESYADWAGRGRVALRVPAGERARLIVLGGGGAPFSFRLERAGCGPNFAPVEAELSVADLAAGVAYRLVGGRWQPSSPGAGGSAVAISASWVGPLASAEERPSATPGPELEQRLRALGYL